jgi:hypothetical protein
MMKRLASYFFLLFVTSALAQNNVCNDRSCTAALTSAGSTCATASACLVQNVPLDFTSDAINVAGTYSGTLQFEASSDYGVTWVSINATPANCGLQVTSTTGTGLWTIYVAGLTAIRVRASAYASGRAIVTLNASRGNYSGTLCGNAPAGSIKKGTLPLTCVVGTIFVDTTTNPAISYICLTPNVFVQHATGPGFTCTGCTTNTLPLITGAGTAADSHISESGGNTEVFGLPNWTFGVSGSMQDAAGTMILNSGDNFEIQNGGGAGWTQLDGQNVAIPTGVYFSAVSSAIKDLRVTPITAAACGTATKCLAFGTGASGSFAAGVKLTNLVFADGTIQTTAAVGGGGTVTHTGNLTANALILGNAVADTTALGSLGTTITVLHGNAAGSPSFGSVVEGDLGLTDITTANVSTTQHGFAPKAPNDATKFLNGVGAYSVPAGGGGGGIGPGALTAVKPILANFTGVNIGSALATNNTTYVGISAPFTATTQTMGWFETYPTAPFTVDACYIVNGTTSSGGVGHNEIEMGLMSRVSGSGIWRGIISDKDSTLSVTVPYLLTFNLTGDGNAGTGTNVKLTLGFYGNFQCFRYTDDNANTCTYGASGDGLTYFLQTSEVCQIGRNGLGPVFQNSGDQNAIGFSWVHWKQTNSALAYDANGVYVTP